MKKAVTGIKPTGEPHLGNYLGAIKPGLELAKEYKSFYFIADYHALNTVKDKKLLQAMSYEVAAAWLACGLNPEEVMFYRQSDVPETFELAILLGCFTPKGLMNRAHAYKAVVAKNNELGKDTDDGVNIGLFTYPVLMAADILLFDADLVPVGKDQKQHVEMTADIAQAVNYVYSKDLLTIPDVLIKENTKTVIGLDGRKMSKSYNNTIPMFLSAKKLRKSIMKIVTNCQTLEEPKDPTNCSIFGLYKLFASESEVEELKQRYLAGGMGWGHAKQALFEKIDEEIAPFREKYNALIADKAAIDKILMEGAQKARPIAQRKIAKLRKAIGLPV